METSPVHLIFTRIHQASALLIVLLLLNAAWASKFRRGLAILALVSLITGAHKFAVGMKDAFPGWHLWTGIKVLLALHVVAMAFLMARGAGDEAKWNRWRKGAAVSSLLTAAIGLYVAHWAR